MLSPRQGWPGTCPQGWGQQGRPGPAWGLPRTSPGKGCSLLKEEVLGPPGLSQERCDWGFNIFKMEKKKSKKVVQYFSCQGYYSTYRTKREKGRREVRAPPHLRPP